MHIYIYTHIHIHIQYIYIYGFRGVWGVLKYGVFEPWCCYIFAPCLVINNSVWLGVAMHFLFVIRLHGSKGLCPVIRYGRNILANPC